MTHPMAVHVDVISKWATENSFLLDVQVAKCVLTHEDFSAIQFHLFQNEENEQNWGIWTESELLMPYMQEIIDAPNHKKSLSDVLERTLKVLKPVISQHADRLDKDEGTDNSDETDDDENFEGYYSEEDVDIAREPEISPKQDDTSADQFFTGDGSKIAVQRLIKDMKSLNSSEGRFGVVGNPKGDNLFIWDVKLTDFDPKTQLGKDLQTFASKTSREPVIYLELKFPRDYPMDPPFARVIRPRFKFLTGHVTIGGSICMELLTRSGWRPINDIENILVQIRSEIMSDPNARLDTNCDKEYDEKEARQAFERTVQRYGWNK